MTPSFWIGIAVTAGVTYLIRLLPILLVKKKIKNRFILSFLDYMPYAVLTVMTVPAIFTATGSVISAVVGFCVALLLAYKGKGLTVVALSTSGAVLVVELILKLAEGIV